MLQNTGGIDNGNNSSSQVNIQQTQLKPPAESSLSSSDNQNTNNPNKTPTIELSVRPEDGSLLVASLSTVIAAACDSLYDEIYDMTFGEIPVAINQDDSTNKNGPNDPSTSNATHSPFIDGSKKSTITNSPKIQPSTPGNLPQSSNQPSSISNFLSQQNYFQMQKMSSLSFAQRRHELGMRISRHSRTVLHLSTLISSYLDSPYENKKHRKNNNMHFPNSKVAECVHVASESLKHVRNAWIRADEAQDALYFSHGGLWRERRTCADIYGALDMICSGSGISPEEIEIDKNGSGGTWTDFPRGLGLQLDRYEDSLENSRSRDETMARLRGAVRRKLVTGEIGYNKNQINKGYNDNRKWRIILERGGGVVKLTYGNGKKRSGVSSSVFDEKNDKIFPIEARLTVLSEDENPEWRLLSIEVNVSPKTGESSHQLEPSNRQKFDLHRLCEETMKREEERIRQFEVKKNMAGGISERENSVPQPLNCLFNVAHAYATSLQLEMLSSQADAIRRGAWSNHVFSDDVTRNMNNVNFDHGGITVSPIHYFENEKHLASCNWPTQSTPTSAMAIHFWSCDDRHGTPKVGDLQMIQKEEPKDDNFNQKRVGGQCISDYLTPSDIRGKKCLSLCFRSVPKQGIVVSLSGGLNVMKTLMKKDSNSNSKDSANTAHIRRNAKKLLNSILDPFQLSSSHALLHATVICAHLRCESVVNALLSSKLKSNTMNENDIAVKGLPSWIHLTVDCGTISVSIQISYDNGNCERSNARRPFEAFRVACDSRTGNFVTLFPPEAKLLRSIVCNDPSVSEIQQYRSTQIISSSQSSLTSSSQVKNTSIQSNRELTGRIVRSLFASLSRSLNILGERVGVGGEWNNDDNGDKLRKRAIENDCLDVQESLMSCCGVAATFGIASRALALITGTDAMVDLAGSVIENIPNALPVPPVSIILKQQIIDIGDNNDEGAKVPHLQRDLLAISGSVCHEILSIHCFDISTRTKSPSIAPERIECNEIPLVDSIDTLTNESSNSEIRHMNDEVIYLVHLLDSNDIL